MIQIKLALRYIANTNGGATKENFIEDNEPVGDWLWEDLERRSLVQVNAEGKIFITDKGRDLLRDQS